MQDQEKNINIAVSNNLRYSASSMSEQEINLNKILCLSSAIILAGLPHWPRLPFWVPLMHIALIACRTYLPHYQQRFWQEQRSLISMFRILIMIAGVTGIYTTYGTLTGRDVGITLLILLSSLKLFETLTKRDFYICAYLGYFLMITNFFHEQTIPIAIYMFIVTAVMTVCLIGYNDVNKQLSILKLFWLSATMLLQSIPALLILFILFPRVNGPLWGLPEDTLTSITGIDDQMTPGSISKLIQSDEVAFRVSFEETIPEQEELYWRGPVLWQTDGRKWTRGSTQPLLSNRAIDFSGKTLRYELMMEPTNKKWIFALEMLKGPLEDTYLTQDYQFKSSKKIQSRSAYTLTSHINYRLDAITNDELVKALALPENSHIQTREFAQTLKQHYAEPEAFIQATLDWLKQENFVYTLSPKRITGDSVDEFLFTTRQGFCEHFAAAFTVLMRSAGIPTRVVIGYLGGEINPLGNFLIVRQYHAHAWTEVWLEESGWTRIDPTAVISPARVEQGIETAIPEAGMDIPLGLTNSTLSSLWQRLRRSVDNINYQWAQWVLGYGPERQKLLLKKFGLDSISWNKLTIMLFLLLGFSIALLALLLLVRQPAASDPAKRYYDRFCQKLSRIGINRLAHEGPLEFATRVKQRRQRLTADVNTITQLYIKVRYHSNRQKLPELKHRVRRFRAN